MKFAPPVFEQKIFRLEALLRLTHLKQPLVFTNGCFDIIHRGHVSYLAQAKTLGKTLIVGVNSDNSVKRQNKGNDRPINNLNDRMAVIASLAAVDYVVDFDEDTPLNLILAIKPDILVKGGDWSSQNIVGSNEVLAAGGAVFSIPFMFDSSTSKLISKIRKYGT